MTTPDFYSLLPQEPIKPESNSSNNVPDFYSIIEPQTQNPDYGYGLREDKTNKGKGFYGMIPMSDNSGKEMSELSIGVNLNGKETLIPSIVPTLTPQEIDYLRSGNPPTQDIIRKASEHASKRLQQGKSPFASVEEEGKTPWKTSPDFYTPTEKAEVSKPEEFDISKANPMVKSYLYQTQIFSPQGLKGQREGYKHQLSAATFGLSEKIPGLKTEPPKDENDAIIQATNRFVGSMLPWGAFERFVVNPIAEKAAWMVAKGTMSVMKPLLTKIGTKMAVRGVAAPAIYSLEKWNREGQIPSKQELITNGATVAALGGFFDSIVEIGIPMHQALSNIAKSEGKSLWEVYKRFGSALKNKGYSFFRGEGKPVTTEVIKETGIDFAKKANQPIEPIEAITLQPKVTIPETVKPKEEIPAITKPEKPINKITADELPKVDLEKLQEIPRHMYKEELDRIIRWQNGYSTDAKGWLMPSLESIYNDLANAHYLTPQQQSIYAILAEKEKLSTDKTQKPISPEEKPLLSKSIEKPEAKKTVPIIPKTEPKKPEIGTKQAAKRSDIIKLFRKAFTDPIRLRKFKQHALGIHKGWPKVTRLLKDNDVETAAHEIGHNLHYTLYSGNAKTPQEQRQNVNNALKPYLSELKPLARYEPFGMEGFAEFTRMYVTNPETIKELAPKFYQKFEDDLNTQYPELKEALLQAREYYDTYIYGTPLSRIESNIAYPESELWWDKVVDFWKDPTRFDLYKKIFLDDLYPAKRLVAEAFGIPVDEVESLKDERNLYRSLRLLKGAIGKGDVFVQHETFDIDNLEKTGEGYKAILDQLKDPKDYKDFNSYLIARNTIEKVPQGIEIGVDYTDAVIVEKELAPRFAKLAKQWDKFWDNTLEYVRKSGLLSPESYKLIKDRNLMYAPMQRDLGKQSSKVISGKGIQAVNPIKKRKTSYKDIIPPVEAGLRNIYNCIISAERNRAGQILAKLADMKDIGKYIEHVPAPTELKAKITKDEAFEQIKAHLTRLYKAGGKVNLSDEDIKNISSQADSLSKLLPDAFTRFGTTAYPAGENIVTVYFDGKPEYYEVSKDIFDMWSKGISPYSLEALPKAFRFFAKTLRAGAILNPKFMLKNVVRDTWGSWLFTRYGKNLKDPVGFFTDMLYQPIAMIAESVNKSPLYVAWMKAGGGMSTMQGMARDQVVKKISEIQNGFSPYQILAWLRQIGAYGEEANRLAEFSRALQAEEKTRLGMEIAAYASRDLSIDFLKAGLLSRAINQIIPFFNATLQGADKLYRTMKDPNTRPEAILRIISMITIPSMILWFLNKDDKDIKERSAQERDQNFLFRLWGNNVLKIPVPFETGVLAHGLTQRFMDYAMTRDPDAFIGFFESVKSATLPSAIPTIVLPYFESIANKSFFTGTRIVPAAQEKLISKYQYKTSTSETSRLLSRAAAYMLGQDTRSKAASPAIIEHYILTWTGGLGKLMLNISDASLNAAGLGNKIPKPDVPITERLGLDAFVSRNPRSSSSSIEKFYDMYQDAISRKSSYDYAAKQGIDTEEEIEAGHIRAEKIYDYNTLKMAHDAMQANQKEINEIYYDPTIDPKTKRMLIDDLYNQMIEFARNANEDIKKYILDTKPSK